MSCACETLDLILDTKTPMPFYRTAKSALPNAETGPKPVGRALPDSTKIDPEFVWGDEGPING
jgi:hypothetical protein